MVAKVPGYHGWGLMAGLWGLPAMIVVLGRGQPGTQPPYSDAVVNIALKTPSFFSKCRFWMTPTF